MTRSVVREHKSPKKTCFAMFRNSGKMKKAPRETQTLCAACNKAEPKIFAPPQTPSRGPRAAKI